MRKIRTDKLSVNIYKDRGEMGRAAAKDIAACIRERVKARGEIRIIFAAAPSQNEVLAALAADPSVPWEKVHAFHMDEYIGLPAGAPQAFSAFLKNAIFDRVPFASVDLIDGTRDPAEEARRYAALLLKAPIDIVCLGIGENGHIAFNDPHAAEFYDNEPVKIVDLDEVCRTQQVHDGCFAALDDVPCQALTLTVPTLMCAARHFCIVPGASKADAVRKTVCGPITADLPATALRLKDGARMYCDEDSAREIL